jgi:hypothetical protein
VFNKKELNEYNKKQKKKIQNYFKTGKGRSKDILSEIDELEGAYEPTPEEIADYNYERDNS